MLKRFAAVALAALALTGCDRVRDAMTHHTDIVARAAGHVLTVDHAATMIAENPRLPAQEPVAEAVANIWTDYMLLATAAAKDSTLSQIDLASVVKPEMEQQLVYQLRDKVVHPDTTVSDSALQQLYEQQQPDVQVKARHILIRVNPNDSQAKKDSALALAQQLQKRAAAGEDFAKLAKQYSQDPGSAKNGGDLGWFGHGQMVGPFEQAAFKLKVGQVSGVVETPFGYHIIKVEDKKVPKFDDEKTQFRAKVVQQREQEAERKYIQDLTDPMHITVEKGAEDIVRELAKQGAASLSGRAAARPLVSYQGGAYTAANFQEFLSRLVPPQRSQFVDANDDQLDQVLKGLTTNQILVAEAQKQGFTISQKAADSMQVQVRDRLRQAVAGVQLLDIKPQQGETAAQAMERRVDDLVAQVIKGTKQVLPLGPISYALRQQMGAEINTSAFPQVVKRLKDMRGPAATPGTGTGAATQPPTSQTPAPAAGAAPDTSGAPTDTSGGH